MNVLMARIVIVEEFGVHAVGMEERHNRFIVIEHRTSLTYHRLLSYTVNSVSRVSSLPLTYEEWRMSTEQTRCSS